MKLEKDNSLLRWWHWVIIVIGVTLTVFCFFRFEEFGENKYCEEKFGVGAEIESVFAHIDQKQCCKEVYRYNSFGDYYYKDKICEKFGDEKQ